MPADHARRWARRVALATALATACAFAAPPPSVNLATGTVQGSIQEDGSLLFRRIPYAAPPLASLRWRAPQPPAPWQGVRDATVQAPPCVQPALGWNNAMAAHGDEDCLYVEVQTPTLRPAAPLPVMVWIHGGANVAGSADILPSALVRQGVVLVTVQYRLGVFGFLSLPEMQQQAPGEIGANFYLQDQLAALRWVRDNIAVFGGDPARVTIFGQSAGAQDVGQLMLVPAARGLFSAAIEQSGTAGFGLPGRPLAEQQRLGAETATRAGIAPGARRLARLRALPADKLVAASMGIDVPGLDDDGYLWLQPVIDGRLLPAAPQALLAAGKQAPVPLLLGSNARELTYGGGEAGAQARLRRDYPQVAARVLAVQAGAPARYGDAATRLATDLTFRCPALAVARAQVARGVPVWHYEFELAPPGAEVSHSSELGFVFRGLAMPGDATLARYWANFARSGDPNGDGLPAWPAFAGGDSLRFTTEGPRPQVLGGEACRLLSLP